jgi:hypothetical protein
MAARRLRIDGGLQPILHQFRARPDCSQTPSCFRPGSCTSQMLCASETRASP